MYGTRCQDVRSRGAFAHGDRGQGDSEDARQALDGMRACHAEGAAHGRSDHVKCSAIAELRPDLFLGVAAGETWRLFTVVEENGRAVLGDELPDLDGLHFLPGTRPAVMPEGA